MRGMVKSFGGVRVLDRVDFAVAPGEIVALLGSNGAGKSTLVKILTGNYSADGGSIADADEELAITEPRDAIAHGIRLIPQELSVLPDLTVAENVCIGNLPSRTVGGIALLDRKQMRAETTRLLAELGVGPETIAADDQVERLPVARRRVVEIARALAGQARYVVMDEPTASLPDAEAEHLFAVTRRLAASGVGVIYISHYLDEVRALCDRIVVLRDGKVAGRFELPAASRDEIITAMLGSTVGSLYEHATHAAPAEPLLEVHELAAGKQLKRISFSVGRGEIVGIYGLVGSGIEELGRALAGARPFAGTVALAGQPYAPQRVADALALGVGLVAAERKAEGIFDELSVRANMTIPFLDRYSSGGRLDQAAERRTAAKWISDLGIQCRGAEQPIHFLSGGNQQKVCLARWLVDGLRLLICEEPTRGVDIGSRRDIYRELRAMAESGVGILVISSEVEEIAGISDRSHVLRDGQIAGSFAGGVAPAELAGAAMASA